MGYPGYLYDPIQLVVFNDDDNIFSLSFAQDIGAFKTQALDADVNEDLTFEVYQYYILCPQ